MKKTVLIILMIFSMFFMTACNQDDNPELKSYTKSFINTYMDTYIRIDYHTDDEVLAAEVADGIEMILAKYHDLTNNYDEPSDDAYRPNIYEINQRIGEKIEIHQDLYDVLVLAEEMKDLTDGYFDIGIGKLVDLWKSHISSDCCETVYENNVMPDDVFDATVAQAEAMDFSDNEIILTEENGSYYIETAGENLKLDLGAISKGYATQKIREYLIEKGLTYFMINSGTSSFVFGENSNRDTGMYLIGLEDPNNPGEPYGAVYVKDTSLTTSGNFTQYVLHNGLRYHHIVSPMTHLPMQYYHTLSLIADDAGILDALSTALFSMSPDVLEAWLSEHQETLGLEVVTYNYDDTVSTYLIDTVYEEQ